MARNIFKIFEIEEPEPGVSLKNPFPSKGNNSEDRNITLKIGTGNITVSNDPIMLYRCQVEPCEVDKASDKCFLIEGSTSDANEVIITNIGYGELSVEYLVEYGSYCIELPANTSFKVCGEMEISYSDGKLYVDTYKKGTITMQYKVGEKFPLNLGDKVHNKSNTLIYYEPPHPAITEDEWI